jgi:protein-tyrosine phosphatase
MMTQSISEVAPNLWICGFPLPEFVTGFDKLIFCAAEHQPDPVLYPQVHVLHVPLTEAASETELKKAVQAGRAVAGWMKRGKNVLVTSAMGANRAGLVAAVALMTRGRKSKDAIDDVRAARGNFALNSPHYISLLKRLEDARAFYVAT